MADNIKIKKDTAVVFNPCIKDNKNNALRSDNEKLDEAMGLALAISNLQVIDGFNIKISEINPATFIGKGKIEEFKNKNLNPDLIIFNCSLSPIQQRNLEKEFDAKVIDRTALILEIFGQRAKTKEGIMQVDLAHLSYQRSRLVRSWTHLERQRGGFGFMGGPGETQIEIDRRIIDEKIAKIKYQLEKIKKTRKLHRKARKDVPYPVVALVGYTNAGKSTLFNYLTDAGVMEKDLLFATLDPTMRKVSFPLKTEIILSDTVGFISDLPHELIAAFRATLEEVLEADIIVHVRDAANPQSDAQKQDVLKVLKSLGLDEMLYKSLIEVLNKIDKLNNDDKNALLNKAKRTKEFIPISAKTGEGIPELLNVIDNKIKASFINVNVNVNINNGKLISWIYDNSQVLSVSDNEEYKNFNLKISSANFQKLQAKLTSFC